jgi:hypothetical protein
MPKTSPVGQPDIIESFDQVRQGFVVVRIDGIKLGLQGEPQRSGLLPEGLYFPPLNIAR